MSIFAATVCAIVSGHSYPLATESELAAIEDEAKNYAKTSRQNAWKAYQQSVTSLRQEVSDILGELILETKDIQLKSIKADLDKTINPLKLDAIKAVKRALRISRGVDSPKRDATAN